MSVSVHPAASTRSAGGSGLPLLALAGILWGTGGLTGTLLARTADLPSLAVAAYRLALGGIIICAVLAATGGRLPRGRAAWVRVLLVALLAALFQACFFTAVSLTSVSLATLVTIGASPVLVLSAERLLGRRAADARMAGTVGLAVVGLGLLVGLPSGSLEPVAVLTGSALAVLAGAGFAAITLLAAHPVAGLDDLTTTGVGFTLGGTVLLPVAAAVSGIGFRPGVASVGLLLLLAIAPTAVAYTLYFRGLRSVGPAVGAVMALLEPLTGTVLAAAVLGERLGTPGLAGAVLLAVAVVLAGTAPRNGTPVRVG
jgi:DME family drug/metabolite transporter